jgi:hypothetical protein
VSTKQLTMRKLILTKALVLVLLTSLIGLTQVRDWTQFWMFAFGISMSLGMLGLLATEKN